MVQAPSPPEQGLLEETLRSLPESLPVLPLRGTVVYPFATVPLTIGQERSVRVVDAVMQGDRLVVLAAQRRQEVEGAMPPDIARIGTVGRIVQLLREPEGRLMIAVQGLRRVRLGEYLKTDPYLVARFEVLPERVERDVETEALRRHVIAQFQRLVELANYLPDELAEAAAAVEDPLETAYLIAASLRMDVRQKQELLELDSTKQKLEQLSAFLGREIQILELGKRIRGQAAEQVTRAQREYLLREQLRAIRRELGEEEGEAREIEQFRALMERAQLPDQAREEVERELHRLEVVPSASPEYNVIRTYLDWMTHLPWNVCTGHKIDVSEAKRILDEDHYDLEKVKERILEHLAVRKFKEERNGEEPRQEGRLREPILCLVGPPGVGKTSLGQSIARALGRKFVRISLGGVHDEAEIRGHRRTYVGAMPGRIIQGLRRAGSRDPVMLLDELDKVGADWRGDPAAALLEVLDPTQNHAFVDHYLGVSFDLSQVLFLTTANTLETVPPALRDRLEVLNLPGYTEEEKVKIAQRFLLPKQLRAHGLRKDELRIGVGTLRRIVREYTREAGVRNLEREIAAIVRKAARELAEGKAKMISVTESNLPDYLGRPRFYAEVAERTERPGVATALAWTPSGGDIMFIEATIMPGRQNRLILTGMLGDVMRESAQTALSYVRSNAERLGVDARVFEDKDIHVHVPAGAIPKDGPSAGIAIATAIASLVTGRPVRHDVAMTGEVTLRGRVLPVGGIREKVLAAHRSGIKRVILPARNERDLDDVPPEARQQLAFSLVDTVDEVLAMALSPEPARPDLQPAALHPEAVAARGRETPG